MYHHGRLQMMAWINAGCIWREYTQLGMKKTAEVSGATLNVSYLNTLCARNISVPTRHPASSLPLTSVSLSARTDLGFSSSFLAKLIWALVLGCQVLKAREEMSELLGCIPFSFTLEHCLIPLPAGKDSQRAPWPLARTVARCLYHLLWSVDGYLSGTPTLSTWLHSIVVWASSTPLHLCHTPGPLNGQDSPAPWDLPFAPLPSIRAWCF